MCCTNTSVEELVIAGTKRLLDRATNMRSLDANALYARVGAALEKYLLRHQSAPPRTTIEQFLDALHADDLCLVVACEQGNEEAWGEVIAGYRAIVLREALHVTRREDAADELAGSIWAELYGLRSDKGGRPMGKLAYYSGLGPLGGWLRAVVRQVFVNRYRQDVLLTQLSEETQLNSRKPSVNSIEGRLDRVCWDDPERSLQKRQINTHMLAALSKAIQTVHPEDRLLLSLYYLDDLSMEEVGKVLGVHQATISRRLTKLHLQLRSRVRVILEHHYGWSTFEIDTNVGEVIGGIDMNFSTLFAERWANSVGPFNSQIAFHGR